MIYLVKGLKAEGNNPGYLRGRLRSDEAGITVERAGGGLRLIIDIAKLSTIVAVTFNLVRAKSGFRRRQKHDIGVAFNDPSNLSRLRMYRIYILRNRYNISYVRGSYEYRATSKSLYFV